MTQPQQLVQMQWNYCPTARRKWSGVWRGEGGGVRRYSACSSLALPRAAANAESEPRELRLVFSKKRWRGGIEEILSAVQQTRQR